MAFRIETNVAVVQGFVADIRAAADTDKEALGFIPASAYDQAARKGELTVALQDIPHGPTYAGHIWVSGLFPHARVVQLFVAQAYRGQKLSTRLLRAAIQSAEASGFLTIFAKVAADLAANQVYEHHGFVVVRTKPGGQARNRQIHIRSRELSTPTLFNYRPTSVVAVDDGVAQSGQQLYLIDLNVFFDATRQRRFTPAAEKILASALNSGVRLAVTNEFVKELQRTTVGKNDPVLSFAKQLPTVSGPSRPEIESLATRLAPTVFPDQTRDGTLSTNDYSDLRHLAEAILAGAAGFVTGENSVLRAHVALREQHGLNVWSTEDFATFLTPALAELPVIGHAEHDLTFTEERSLSAEAVTFLKSHGAIDGVIGAFSRLDAADKRFRYLAAREAQALIAFAACRVAPGPTDAVGLLLVADPRHPATPTALDFLVEHVVRVASLSRPSRVEMAHVDGQSVARITAIENGFVAVRSGADAPLRKIAVGTAVTPVNWAALRDRIQKGTGLALPADCPDFRDDEQEIAVTLDGRAANLPLASLESMTSPGLFLLKGRPVAVVPIRRTWAEDLVGGSQLSLLPKREAAFRSRRVYFASVRNQHILVKGRPIILYESGKDGGRGAAIAIARVASAEAVPKARAPDSLLRAAVVRGGDLQNLVKGTTVLAVWFDNIMRFEHPVSFQRMKGLGLADPTNLVKSHMLEFETAVKILDAGRPDAR
jgi:GNAT superfamily N-acetyltransferase/predicted nucleic acid-binding protein